MGQPDQEIVGQLALQDPLGSGSLSSGLEFILLSTLHSCRVCTFCRKDAVQKLDVGEVLERGGGGCILAERLLPEVAYKLGRAPKYGA